MKPELTTYEQGLREVTQQLTDLIIKKHHDYGTNNLTKFGEFGVVVRCSDQVERLIHTIKATAVPESREDTWLDLAGYALQALMMAKGYFNLPSGSELKHEYPHGRG